MLHILLLILKIIGILLLVILGIVVVCISLILFVPAKYQLTAETTDGLRELVLSAKASWLFHLLTARYVYEERQGHWQVRFGWKKFQRKKHTQLEEDEEVDEVDVTEEETSEQEAEEKVKHCPKFIDKIKCTIAKFCDKIKEIWDTKNKIWNFLTDEAHKNAFQKLKHELFMLVKRIRPRKIRGHVKFGLEDPYHTGQVLAVLSILYPFYGQNVEVEPKFEEKILQGHLYLKGYIPVCVLVHTICRLLWDKHIKKTYKDYKKIKS